MGRPARAARGGGELEAAAATEAGAAPSSPLLQQRRRPARGSRRGWQQQPATAAARQQSSLVALPLALVPLLLLASWCGGASAQPRAMPTSAPKKCGAVGQGCCPQCQPDVPLSACDQWSCSDGAQCFMFANKQGLPPDGGEGFPMICLASPKACGKEGGPCCYNSDPASEDRCGAGLTCVAEGVVPYSSHDQYEKLKANFAGTSDPKVMGTCRKLTKADCGKLWRPCGAAAKKLGCADAEAACGAGSFCASPGDTRLGAPRCLPLPPGCGQLGKACCPPNAGLGAGGAPRERSYIDQKTAVPYCDDGKSMCVWVWDDFRDHGVAQFPSFEGGTKLPWDGAYERGYGRSRCIPLAKSCGQPGEPCCASMMDQRLSGMVHNRQFPYQPCNYRAAGRSGMFCKGAWQGALLDGAALGTCTLNPEDCGKPGKGCCVNDIPEVGGAVGTCARAPGEPQHYCSKAGACERCPAKPELEEQKQNCWGGGGGGSG